jgi:hypothetical protein
MIQGELTADDLGPGTDNEARLAAIRAMLATRFQDSVPFLLLPIRIETRFLQVERPAEGPDEALVPWLEALLDKLRRLSKLPLHTELGGGPREEIKLKETELYTRLDQELEELAVSAATLSKIAVNLSVGDEAQRVAALVDELSTQLGAVSKNVTQLRSAWQRERFTQRLARLGEQQLEPLREQIREVVLPKRALVDKLQTVRASDLTHHISTIERGLAQVPELRTAGILRGVVGELHKVSKQAGGLVAGSEEELRGMRSAWQRLEERLGDSKGPSELERLRRSLAGLGGAERGKVEVLGAQRLARTAAAVQSARSQLETLARALQPRAVLAKDRLARASSLAGEVTATARRVEALRREMAVLPPPDQAALAESLANIQAGFAPIEAELGKTSALSSPTGSKARRQLEEARAALGSLEQSLLGPAPDKIVVLDPRPTRLVDMLHVRIYPDEVAIHTHEELLTEGEVRDGTDYWLAHLAAAGDEARQRSAWRGLAVRYGSNRAAWIARVMKPQVPSSPWLDGVLRELDTLDKRLAEVAARPGKFKRDPAGGLARVNKAVLALRARLREDQPREVRPSRAQAEPMGRLVGRVGQRLQELGGQLEKRTRFLEEPERHGHALESVAGRVRELLADLEDLSQRPAAEPVFPKVQTKAAAWTRAPHCRVLPDRFVVLTLRGGEVTHVVVGQPIGEIKVGLDPDPEHAQTEAFSLDADGNLVVGQSIRWMVDFDEAVAQGMAVRVPLTATEAITGFDEVLVLGVKDTTASGGRQLLQDLLDNHHYGEHGLALLPVGTPTNNTEEQASAFRTTDDVEASYEIEQSAPLFDPDEDDPYSRSDGARLASVLGISPEVLQHVRDAGQRDQSEALLANAVLWPGTIANYVETFVGSLVSVDTMSRTRRFFEDHVSARGHLPSLRVGRQPYGVLLTTAFERFQPSGASSAQQNRFEGLLVELLRQVRRDWSLVRQEKVKHAHSEGVTDAQQHFLEMLGLQATSVRAEYRFGLNVWGRHLLPSMDAGYHTSVQALLQHFESVLASASGLPLPFDPVNHMGWAALGRSVADDRLANVRYLDKEKSLRGPVASSPQTEVAQLLALSPLQWLEQGRHDPGTRSLLYLLLRHALLVELRNAALDILQLEGLLDDASRHAAGAATTFRAEGLFTTSYASEWSLLFGAIGTLSGRFGSDFPDGPGTLFRYLVDAGPDTTMDDYLRDEGLFTGFPGSGAHAALRTAVHTHRQRATRLGQLSRQRLEPLIREHLDLASHRADAWQQGLAHLRLLEVRAPSGGIFLGAYGWVEDLRPDPGPHELATEVPPGLHLDGDPPIYEDSENQGFLHAPSVGHAVAAAILRAGYLTETDEPDLENQLAINLSSRRVRLALELLDGIERGNELGALLGYRFERELHEAYTTDGLSYDDLIYSFRRAFPSVAPVDPSAAVTDEVAVRQVIDGLQLVESVRRWVEENVDVEVRSGSTLYEILWGSGALPGFPWGLPVFGPGDEVRAPGVARALDSLTDTLDALGDLALAEGVYQIVRGNFPRAGAVLEALATGRAMPRPQIVDTPTPGIALTHRVVLPLASGGAGPWATVPPTPRAEAEPRLDRWLGSLLGDPDTLRCQVIRPQGGQTEVSVAQLGLRPLDLLAILGPGLEEGQAELIARIAQHVAGTDADLLARIQQAPDPMVEVRFMERGAGWGPAIRTFYEISPLLESVRELLGKARPATVHDLTFVETLADPQSVPTWDVAEVEARVDGALATLRGVGKALMQLLSGAAPSDADFEALDVSTFFATHAALFDDVPAVVLRRAEMSAVLLRASAFVISHVLPPLRFETPEQVARTLRASVSNALSQVREVYRRAQAHRGAGVPARLLEALRVMFGRSFVPVPRISVPDAPAFAATLASSELLRHGGPLAMDAWMAGAASVRPGLGLLQDIRLFGEAFGASTPAPRPVQIPAVAGDYWLGFEFPADFESGDKLSVLVLEPAAWSDQVHALLIDEWTETIPSRTASTGVAFHHDQPDAEPPQALLLVVPPVIQGRWRWDDLVHCLHDTFELARNRTVELEHLSGTVYGQLLPAVVGELVPDRLGPGQVEVAGSRVILDFGTNNP